MKLLRIGMVIMAVATFALADAADAQEKKKDDHPEIGPHKGALAEWGEEEYHVEVTFDNKEKQAIIYVLDGSAKKAKPIDAKEIVLTLKQKPVVAVKLTAVPEKSDPAGSSSKFVGSHDAFAKPQSVEGTVSGKVGTKPYSGDFKFKLSPGK